jgi:hypothetical protein
VMALLQRLLLEGLPDSMLLGSVLLLLLAAKRRRASQVARSFGTGGRVSLTVDRSCRQASTELVEGV